MSTQCKNCFETYDSSLDICPHCGFTEGDHAVEALHMDPGTMLHDRYRIGRVLGFGGFGVTYLAWDEVLESKVAIKEYLPSEFSTRAVGVSQVTIFSGNKEQQFLDGMEKFVAEAKRLAKFQGEAGIVQIFDSFTENNTAYIVMEYLEGETLTKYLEREGTLPVDVAIGLLTPLIKSLEVVHGEGIIHRDIAPDNIMVTKSGEVKLIDFGAARYATTSHSRSLTVIIKPGYSPEEQYRSRGDQGTHTDVYSAAAVLYRMITGVTPPDALERRALVENGKRDMLEAPSKYVKDIDENVENALLNAMNVRIEDRTPDMGTFFDELMSDVPVKRRVGNIKRIDALKWPLWAKIAVPTGLVVVIALLVLFFTGVIKFDSGLQTDIEIADGMTRVPSVVSEDLDSAEERLYEAGLLYEISGTGNSDTIDADLVLEQDVAGGAVVSKNTIIYVKISSGSASDEEAEDGIQKMPYVQYTDADEAKQTLEEMGLIVTLEEEESETVTEGLVISQSIKSGEEIEEDMEVTLTVSTGAPKFDMPDVVGMTEDEATEELYDLGLSITDVSYRTDTSVDDGTVLEQNVAAGEKMKRGDEVALVVSTVEEIVSVADVVGMSQESAEKELKAQGFTVYINEAYDDEIAIGYVVSQTPEAGSEQKKETQIILTVSKGEEGLKSISVSSKPTKTDYYVGDTLDITGLTLIATYESGNTATITSGFSCDVTDLNKAGKQTIEVTFDGISTSFEVNVSEDTLSGIIISTMPSVTTYYVGDTLSTEGLTLTATYSSGKTETVSDGFTCDPTTLSVTGTQEISVIYEGLSATFAVTVDTPTLIISEGTHSLNVGEAFTLTATPTPGGDVSWTSSNPNVATVSGGTVTAVASGSANITASFTYGEIEYSAACAVTVQSIVTVTFDTNGGFLSSSGGRSESASVSAGASLSYLPDVERDGYNLVGWFTSPSGGSQYTAETIVSENITLYAQWSVGTYSAEYGDFTLSAFFHVVGGKVYMDIPLASGMGVASGEINIVYDSGYMTLDSVQAGNVNPSIDTSTSGLISTSFSSSSEVSGTLLTAVFTPTQGIFDMLMFDFYNCYLMDASGNYVAISGSETGYMDYDNWDSGYAYWGTNYFYWY